MKINKVIRLIDINERKEFIDKCIDVSKLFDGYCHKSVIKDGLTQGSYVGEGSFISYGCLLVGVVKIGKFSMIGYNTMLIAENHIFRPDSLFVIQGMSADEIVIGDDVWVGAGCIVTDSSHIGNHAIVVAGSVITKDIPEWEVWGGVPARKIGDRRTWSFES